MQISKKTALNISLCVIVLYWLYVILIKSQSVPATPVSLEDFMLTIIKAKLIYLVVIYLLLRMEGDTINELGFAKEGISRQVLMGLLFGAGIWIIAHVIVDPLLRVINPNSLRSGTDMSIFMKDFKSVLLWIPFVIFAGGFIEELHRIFVLTRFQKWLGTYGLYLALGISSITFGIGHLYQGLNTAIGTGLGGLLFGLVYLRKRSAVEAMTSHAFFDIISVLGGFMLHPK